MYCIKKIQSLIFGYDNNLTPHALYVPAWDTLTNFVKNLWSKSLFKDMNMFKNACFFVLKIIGNREDKWYIIRVSLNGNWRRTSNLDYGNLNLNWMMMSGLPLMILRQKQRMKDIRIISFKFTPNTQKISLFWKALIKMVKGLSKLIFW